jgi:hypothetical protein
VATVNTPATSVLGRRKGKQEKGKGSAQQKQAADLTHATQITAEPGATQWVHTGPHLSRARALEQQTQVTHRKKPQYAIYV